jgi:CRISPR-associated endonuclease Csn1
MKWRLGIDLGTNSIGWAVLGLDRQGEVESLADLGVRIFSDGREPKSGEPLNVERRKARGIRKNIQRRKRRRRDLFKLLRAQGLFPATAQEAETLKKLDPYELRVKALDGKLEPYELGRALFHLGVRRGFRSNRKDQGDEALPVIPPEDDEAGRNQTGAGRDISKMKQGEKCLALKEDLSASGYRTIGEFLFHQNTVDPKTNKKRGLRFSPGRFPWYPLRELYTREFDAIEEKQKSCYPDIAWDKIREIIFKQRGLKKQERGKCQFEPEYERTFKAMPSSIRFRILQDAYNLAFYDDFNMPLALTDTERDRVIQILDGSRKEVPFKTIREKLKTRYRFNLESDIRTGLKGNETGNILRGERYFGALWDTLSLAKQDDIVETLIEADEEAAVIAAIGAYPLTEAQKKTVAGYVPSSGTTSLCKHLTQRIVDIMTRERCGYTAALDKMGIKHSDEQVEKFDAVPYYGKVLTGVTIGGKEEKNGEKEPEKKYGRIANPTVHVALNQTARVVNALIKKYGKPAQIVIELSRNLKASRDDKEAMRKKQAENAKRNIILNKNITEIMPGIKYPNRADRLKYRLWEELGADGLPRRCLYCGEPISLADLFTGDIEVEHILPFSRTLLDAESNLTVAHAKCNRDKKEWSPYEAFSSNPNGYNWEEICERAERLPGKAKRKRFYSDAMEVFEKENSFIARQLTDNAYLSKLSRKYLKTICDDVWVIPGGMTKLLRDRWEIDSILKRKITEKEIMYFDLKPDQIGLFKKNRYDHRHHALDAMVIGLVDRAMVQHIATLCGRSQKRRIEVPALPFLYREIAEKVRNIAVSFKPDHGVEGKLSKETALGRIKLEMLIPVDEITHNDIPNLKDQRIREEFEKRLEESNNIKAAVKELRGTYPQVRVFRYCFAARTPVTSLKEDNINKIIDVGIQKRLRDFIGLYQNERFENILVRFGEETGIKRVRCKTFQATIPPISPRPGKPLSETRYYNPLDYFTAIIWEIPSNKEGSKPKYEAQFVRRNRAEIDGEGRPVRKRPHPAAREVCVLFKNDYVEFSENGIWKKARIAGYSATQGQLDVRPIYATDDAQSWIIATSEQMLEKGWKPQKGQNYISVNVLFGACSARKITVSPIGEVRRISLR